ncbi:MAG TPA: invasion associated locus B family protein [Rhizomicrobium sp.]|nr:invasion associated locus B family protein [Rhizomicrobium sp.]
MNRLLSIGFAAALAVTGSAALAQDDSAPAPQSQAQRKPITPTTMKTFSGWDVRCYPVQTPAPCDMWEAIAFKKGGALAVSVSIVFVPSRNEHLLQFVVPLGIDLPKGARLVAGAYTSEMWRYHHCDRIGCYVIVPQGNAVVDALKGQPDMKVRVVQFHGKSFDLNVPLKGFDEAHDSMVELARQKATTKAAPAPDANP